MILHNEPSLSAPQTKKKHFKKTKRFFDVFASLVILIPLLPVMGLILLCVMRDGGPGLFGHQRIGRRGMPFTCLKFRTMRVDGDAVLAELLATDTVARKEWNANRKLIHDPRVTPFGRLLRSTSLDELPQLLNVLRGDMSLVGPRPVTQNELDLYYEPDCARLAYLSVRPGITGPWQVGGRSELSYPKRVALDHQYAEQQSLRTDMLILFRTINVVMRRTGAH
ncbi:sugar transferase [Paeniroseomonas aquatica]|uniref:Sugar transferase n=2 Tax=Paeniroseomonas aquatica TaxID=373043 RepID=A0ABT8A8H3_9PROT|nr:sugar transferase [Paeniroseomonas aquatica]MDN3566067.1 sugar transferase [Paeniroseomonas aquatica]